MTRRVDATLKMKENIREKPVLPPQISGIEAEVIFVDNREKTQGITFWRASPEGWSCIRPCLGYMPYFCTLRVSAS